jgi:hypothetical protein
MSDAPSADAPLDEREMLLAWLGHLRTQVAATLDGLTEEEARWAPAKTANSVISIVQHLGYVERWWYQACFAGLDVFLPWNDDDDADFRVAPEQRVSDIVAFYREECDCSDEIIRSAASLDQMSAHLKVAASLRWIVTHMVEETARHAGHADITRELLDIRRGS